MCQREKGDRKYNVVVDAAASLGTAAYSQKSHTGAWSCQWKDYYVFIIAKLQNICMKGSMLNFSPRLPGRNHVAVWEADITEVKCVEQTCSPPAFMNTNTLCSMSYPCVIIMSQRHWEISSHCFIRHIVIAQRWIVSIVPPLCKVRKQCQRPEVWHLPVICCLHKSLGLIRMLIPEVFRLFHLTK